MDKVVEKEVLIVGQGIAGTLFSYLCYKNGISFDVVDNNHASSSSIISAGVINPVTGRRYAKSWEYENLKTYFLPFYREMGELLNIEVIREMEAVVILHSAEAINFWDTRKHDPEYDEYLSDDPEIGIFKDFIKENETGKILGCYQVAIEELLTKWRDFLVEKGNYIESSLDINAVSGEKPFRLHNRTYDKVVLSVGAEATRNGLWNEVEFDLLKGEVLIDESRDFSSNMMLKRKLFFVPLPSGKLWIGATYDRDYIVEGTTDEAKEEMLKTVEEFLNYEPVISRHHAALRPTIRDRRSVVGQHPQRSGVYILNGLGAKGMSLGPYCATMLYEHIFNGSPIPKEMDLMRFYDKG